MNQGFFGFPNISIKDRPDVLIKEFDSSGTFVIPPFAKRLYILLIGAGGSGGSGARHPSGTNSSGGSGGAGGRYFVDDLPLSVLNAPPGTVLTVVIGAGGSASTGSSLDGTNGAGGSPGGNSSITIEGKRGNLIVSTGGVAGAAGTTAASATGAAGAISWWFGNLSGIGHGGGNSGVTNYPQGPGTTPLPAATTGMWNWQSNGGCGGGGVDGTTNTACYGGAPTAGGLITSQYSTLYSSGNNVIQAGAPNDTTIYTYNPDSIGYTIAGAYTPGMGGVGGGGGATTDGGRGRNGWRGGGGGGGGGARNGFNGGNGGAGGDGYCVLIAY